MAFSSSKWQMYVCVGRSGKGGGDTTEMTIVHILAVKLLMSWMAGKLRLGFGALALSGR